jgi:hypothetical protein
MRTIAPLGLDFRPVSALNIVDAGTKELLEMS